MNVLVIFGLTVIAFSLAYRFYGRYVERVFDMSDENPTPAHARHDARDYVPTRWQVVFSHHFSSIAGGGPIVGPAIALVYGFYPSWLWVVLGAIFIGSVHDFTALFVSIREGGKSIVEVTRGTMGRAAYALFIVFVMFMVVLVTAAFLGLTTTALTSLAPLSALGLDDGQSVLRTVADPQTGAVKARIGGVASTSVMVITAFAPLIGYLLYRKRMRVSAAAAISVAVAAFSIAVGLRWPMSIGTGAWMLVISCYVFVAAGLPVWFVLQPRDFVNSLILYSGVAVLAVGIVSGGLSGMKIAFPAVSAAAGSAKVGLIWPIMFITVACGAISGFHSLIASGTTSKQISRESHARRIGFGAMLLEGLLAVAVLITISSAVNFSDYLSIVFPEGGRSNPVLAFSLGMGKMLSMTTPLPAYAGTIFGILLVEGFLVTTLDTAVRLNRYLLEEIWQMAFKNPPRVLRSYFFNAGLSVALMLLFARKQAFLALWPVFGSANQLLAALSLITVTVWLLKRGKGALFTFLPAIFMVITAGASLVYLFKTKYLPAGNLLLMGLAALLVALSIGVAALAWKSVSGRRTAHGPSPLADEEAGD